MDGWMTAEPLEVNLILYLAGALPEPAYPYQAPQSVTSFPTLLYRFVDALQDTRLGGITGLAMAMVQFDALARSLPEALVLVEQLRQVMEGYSGPMGSYTIQNSTLVELPGGYIEAANSSDLGAFRRSVRYEITYSEPRPA